MNSRTARPGSRSSSFRTSWRCISLETMSIRTSKRGSRSNAGTGRSKVKPKASNTPIGVLANGSRCSGSKDSSSRPCASRYVSSRTSTRTHSELKVETSSDSCCGSSRLLVVEKRRRTTNTPALRRLETPAMDKPQAPVLYRFGLDVQTGLNQAAKHAVLPCP